MAENEIAEITVETTEAVEETVIDADDDGLPEKVKAVLAKERAAARAAEMRAKDAEARAKEYEDRDKSEAQKNQDELEALRAERDSLRSNDLRREVADAKGLTPAQAKRLVGATREELEADADEVLEVFPSKPAKPQFAEIVQGHQMEGNPRIYRQAEINDHAFWKANKADILAAITEGRVTD